MMLQCEWDGCGEEYEVEAFNGFRDHVEEHLKDLLPSYYVSECNDALPQEFNCLWMDCGWDPTGEVHEFFRHCLFHAFHTKLKALGFQKQQEMKLPQCTLDVQTRNLVPDFPEPFICEWESCHMEFNCAHRFFHHVDAHAIACDKTGPAATGKELTSDGECFRHGHEDKAGNHIYCQWTDCKFFSKGHYKLREHCRSHTREKLFACATCGGMFANHTKFVDHLKRQNSSGYESFQCSHCLKHCGSQRILRDHMRHHVNSIKCQFCDMTCPNPSALKQHIRFRHSEERPYSCDMCNYSCKTSSDLRRHRESHNAVFGYQCTVEGCEFTSRAMQTLKRHHKVAHQGGESARYECHMCGSRYTRGTGLTHHLKTKHKFRWPAGHPRFRYKEHEDGILRLQTVRFESVELSQQLNSPMDNRQNITVPMSAGDQVSFPATSSIVDEDVHVDGSYNCKRAGEANVSSAVTYRSLLEQNEAQEQSDCDHHEQFQNERNTNNYCQPYQRTEEIVSQTLLALQEAAVHLVRQ